jgi:hypothetical protein
LPAPYHLVHGLQLQVNKPAHKFAMSAQVIYELKAVMHLHQCLRIIPSPLLEVLAFRKVLKPCKRWG